MSDEISPRRIYLDARRLCWFAAVSLVLLMAGSLVLLRADSVPVLAAGVSVLGLMVGAYAGIERIWGGKGTAP